MFSRDRWKEIFDTISKNKLRTFLSGFTVALGIFIFIILFGPTEIPEISKKMAKFYRDIIRVKDDLNDSVNNEINDLKEIKKDIEKKD